MSGIYMIANLIDKKIYIGSSVHIGNRCARHKRELRKGCHSNIYLQRAWNKYDEANFEFSTLEEVAKEFLLDREQHWIDSTESYNRDIGYNIQRYAGRGMEGMIHTEEAIEKMRESHKGEKHHFFGKKHSKEHIQKMSNSLKGRKCEAFSNDHRNKMSMAQKGEKHSQAKLTEIQVREIRGLFRDTDVTSKKISEIYNVSLGAINGIRYYNTWKHVKMESES